MDVMGVRERGRVEVRGEDRKEYMMSYSFSEIL